MKKHLACFFFGILIGVGFIAVIPGMEEFNAFPEIIPDAKEGAKDWKWLYVVVLIFILPIFAFPKIKDKLTKWKWTKPWITLLYAWACGISFMGGVTVLLTMYNILPEN